MRAVVTVDDVDLLDAELDDAERRALLAYWGPVALAILLALFGAVALIRWLWG
jgi:hypothetical protein